MNLPEIASIGNIKGKRALVRVDFNLPIHEETILDDSRLRKSLETINFLREKGAVVILISHIETGTLKQVSRHLFHFVPHEFFQGEISDAVIKTKEAKPGDVFLLENLRKNKGEEENGEKFATELSMLGDFFVNEAFSVSHRPHASIIGIPKHLPSFVGFQFIEEIINLSQVFNPKHPFLFVLGGAKFETKVPLLKKFLDLADEIFVTGAIMNDFFLAQGYEVGKSKVSEKKTDLTSFISNPKLRLPTDVVVSVDGKVETRKSDSVGKEEKIVDVGPEAMIQISESVSKAKTVLWNGPLGNYEAGFAEGTKELAHKIAEHQKSFSIVGGGDTAVFVHELQLENKFDFVSTGGGATLDFLANETLPGIQAIASRS